ncbi:MAG: class I SAM-dependent methyltransferase [Rhodospirillales bacterium]|nr:MAG: class I SAM-dependent methyltransferase [Rhodospirillales bacterium]
MSDAQDTMEHYFSGRELARKEAFSGIWGNELHAVFKDVAPYYDVASNVASLGMCKTWRHRFLNAVELKPGDAVLDVCAGTNAVGIGLLKRQPAARVCAMDRSQAMQDVGQELARANGVQIESVVGDVHHLPFQDNSFDVATLQWASRHLQIFDVFREVQRVLKPGGCFYHCDMLRPESPVVQRLYSTYLKGCVSATAWLFGSGAEARSCRDYFVEAVELFYSSREITDLLEHVGFSPVTSQDAVGGVMAIHRATKV